MPTEDLRARYTKKTMFADMLRDEEAVKAIERVSPLLQYFLGTGNEDFLYESLDSLSNLSYMGFSPEIIHDLSRELLNIYD